MPRQKQGTIYLIFPIVVTMTVALAAIMTTTTSVYAQKQGHMGSQVVSDHNRGSAVGSCHGTTQAEGANAGMPQDACRDVVAIQAGKHSNDNPEGCFELVQPRPRHEPDNEQGAAYFDCGLPSDK